MFRKTSCLMVLLIVLGGLAIGCSDETSRITNPAEDTRWDELLSTGADEPGITLDFEEYISQGYYYPEDPAVNGNPYVELGQPSDDDIVSDKDIDDMACR